VSQPRGVPKGDEVGEPGHQHVEAVAADDLVVIGLSLSSSWGNGHATTYRALLGGLASIGQRVLFLERDVPWYAGNRDLPDPDFCELAFYTSTEDLRQRFQQRIARAGSVIIGSYVPDGIAAIDIVLGAARGPIGFYDIDTPVTLAALDAGEETYLSARQIPELDLYFSFTGGPTLDRLRHKFGARRPCALYCAVDEARYRAVDCPPRWDLGYLGTYSPDRQPALERLLLEPARRLPDMRFVVAGPQYPRDIEWPANVERVEHLPPANHAAFYAAQRFTLNITRAAMITAGWSPSVRLFEAAACGTPIISDRWPGLADLLPECDAILIADDTDAVVAALANLTEPARRRIGQRARAIVSDGHTGAARAADLLRHIRSVGADQTSMLRGSLHADLAR
jgi:spore maturation protein CgeB